MKLGIVGKGGAGKTTVCALLAQAYRERGRRVVAVETDSNPNLAMSLGLSLSQAEAVPPLPRSLVVGAGGELAAEQLIGTYGRNTPSGVTLVSAINVGEAGAGCTCSGHATVRSLLGEALGQVDVTIVDMEAGLEHLSRSGGTLAYADVLLVVMDPSRKSVITAARTLGLADELGIARVYGVGNKARLPDDGEFFARACAEHGVPLAGIVPFDPDVVEADRFAEMVDLARAREARSAVGDIVSLLDSPAQQRAALLRQRDDIDRRLAQLEAGA
ncbi:MAG TPA: AAA family ATPase [Egibacteraceae bacterium]|nr:AAA family ATPase [Egibacteraceae bacterium]